MSNRHRLILVILIFILVLVAAVGPCANMAGQYDRFVNAFSRSDDGKKLIIGRANDAISLDPASTTEMDSFKVTVNIFETLVKYESEGNNIVPCLAESWKSSEDGLTWVFRLRQGVRFHDGTSFNAHAVTFNFHRWMDAGNPYHNGQFSYWNYIFGGFPGFVRSVTALSDYTVEIKLSKPFAPFLSALAMPVFGISSPDAIKKYGDDLYQHPVGTGPFCFELWEPNVRIVLCRNDKYWNSSAKVGQVEFRVIPSNADRLGQLRQGEIHIADNLNPEDVVSIENEIKSDSKLYLYLRPSFNVGYIAINNEKPPFDVREVRAAISHAINKEALIKDVFNNLAKPAKTFIPPILWGYNENIVPYEYDPEKSKQLLADAGYPDGFKTMLWVMEGPREYFSKPVQVAEYVKENLAQINIQAEIKVFDFDEYLKRIENGEHQLALIGWTGDYIDPDNFLYTLLASDNAKPGLAGNYSFYKNKNADQLLTQARQTSNMVFRKSLYRNLLEIVNYDTPSIPLVHTMPVLAARLSVKGFIPHMTGVESLEHVDIGLE